MNLIDKLFGLFRTVGISLPIGSTGYNRMRSYITLLDACYQGINNLAFHPVAQDSTTTTFCNEFVASVSKKMGCNDFTNMLANQMIHHMESSADWSPAAMDKAQWLACTGTLVIAGEKADPHGHVCIIIPGVETRAIHWSCSAPVCANMGKDVFMGKGVNWAFREIPKFYVWRPSL